MSLRAPSTFDRLCQRLAPRSGSMVARASLRLAAERIGKTRETLDDSDVEALGVQLRSVLRGIMRPTDADAAVDDLLEGGSSSVGPESKASSEAAPEATREAAAARTRADGPGEPPLVGRDADVAKIVETLSALRLVTITGPGGVGKSTLARLAARRLGSGFPDGVFAVELDALSDEALAISQIARGIGVRDTGAAALADAIVERLRAKKVLLVIDGCEAALGPVASLVRTLLDACSRIRIVVTGREPLGITGESILQLRPLDVPAPSVMATAAAVASCGATRLLATLLARADPSFAVSDANAGLVARACRNLDGLPLALELTAATAGPGTALDVLRSVADDARPAPAGDGEAQGGALGATVDRSYARLDDQERLLFQRLAVFAGGASLRAVAFVCEGEGLEAGATLRTIERLVRKSLVVSDESETDPRHHMLEPVRRFAAAALARAGDEAEVRARHCDWFAGVAEQADVALRKGGDQESSLALVERELQNMRTALAWSTRVARDARRALRLARGLGQFWIAHGYWSEGRNWLETALGVDGEPTSRTRALVHFRAGNIAMLQGDRASALEHAAEAARLGALAGDAGALAVASFLRGDLAFLGGEREVAALHYDEAVHQFEAAGDATGRAGATHNRAHVALELGDVAGAERLFEACLAQYEALDNAIGRCSTLNSLGMVAARAGDNARGRTLLERGLGLARELGSRWHAADALLPLATIALDDGDLASAEAMYRAALEICDALGNTAGVADALGGLACAAWKRGDAQRTLRLAGAAAAVREANDEPASHAHGERVATVAERALDAVGRADASAAFDSGKRNSSSIIHEEAMKAAR